MPCGLHFLIQGNRQKKKFHLCGLSLLLKLLELLGCDKADWFVPSDQLRTSRHGGQDDVPAQTADTAQKKERRRMKNMSVCCQCQDKQIKQ